MDGGYCLLANVYYSEGSIAMVKEGIKSKKPPSVGGPKRSPMKVSEKSAPPAAGPAIKLSRCVKIDFNIFLS